MRGVDELFVVRMHKNYNGASSLTIASSSPRGLSVSAFCPTCIPLFLPFAWRQHSRLLQGLSAILWLERMGTAEHCCATSVGRRLQ